jgi:hypothetical protein
MTAVMPEAAAWETVALAGLSMATSASVGLEVLPVGVRDNSPSQERLSRIAAMLREAEMSAHPSAQRRAERRRAHGGKR